MNKMQVAKGESGYINHSVLGTNGLGKHVELNITVWQKRQKFEIYTSRGMSLTLDGGEATSAAKEIIALLQPIADSEDSWIADK